MKILATYNIKGGVGKTATAVNLSYLAAQDGLRVLLWDLDPQAAASFLFRIRPRVKGGGKALIQGSREIDDSIKGTDFADLDLLPADFTYRNLDLVLGATKKPTRRIARLLAPLADQYDVIFLDCPPGISLLSERASCRRPTACWSRSSRQSCRCAPWTSSPTSSAASTGSGRGSWRSSP
jgi:cellulose biosynthesis protein BcsQ